MAIAVQTNAVRYIDVAANDVINVTMHLDEAEHVNVLYGNASLVAQRGVDYTVQLMPDSFDSFSVTILQSLVDKIDALIAGNANEENAITIRRTLPLKTESTPANVRYTRFTSQEFDRIIMILQQVQEQLDRAVQQPPINVGETGESIYVYPGTQGALAQYNADGDVVPGPQVNDVVTVAGIATEIAALSAVAAQVDTLSNYTMALAALGPRASAIEALGIRTAMIDTLYGLADEIDALYDVRLEIAALGPTAAAIASLDTVKAQIVSLEAIKAELQALYGIRANIVTVAGIAANVTTVAGISADVTTVAGISDDVQDVANNLPLIQDAVDALPQLGTKVSKAGDTMTGPLILSASALAAGAVVASVLTVPAGAEVVTVAGNGQIWDIHPVRPFGAKLTIISAQDRVLGAGTTVGLRGATQAVAKANVAVHFVSDGTKWQLEGGATLDRTRWTDRAQVGPMPISPEMLRHAAETLPFQTYKWFDEKANRPAAAQWQNTSGKMMIVVANHFGGSVMETIDVLTDGNVWVRMSAVATAIAGTATVSTVSFIVPAGGYFRRAGGPATLNWWSEFRATD